MNLLCEAIECRQGQGVVIGRNVAVKVTSAEPDVRVTLNVVAPPDKGVRQLDESFEAHDGEVIPTECLGIEEPASFLLLDTMPA